ncbi:Uma2 family endonuclease [Geobacillus stearothermophilus]|uniref:Uma2 family endonuclease n=1 Tax=Geobacillus stearothermophilus TaxID=1422 RepID=UPI0005196579|nr:Uma2 family endonuclease [Geobacillus stearothermophilus]KMY57052.1 endonuclease [Geobacillus stearothermophilus]KOR94841.1 endonuclease [Geobacillus stearothermophilus ATCC 12980]MED3724284.1 Uma2 family endonuclease [Geobacillus stearothermophilus]MED3748574.1 Uma2 family endonuclease [Geobacillus stearothermophilus]MED3754346.1 Uma2 family endonuclease [Geobacillus stearothermophilus]
MPAPEKGPPFTYAQYMMLDEDARYEVIDGQVFNMSPVPTPKHQAVQRELLVEFAAYLRGKTCTVFGAPIDVCLADRDDPEQIREWVEPDLVIVCDKSKIREKRIVGVPDLVVEIISKSTVRKDKIVKFHRYERAGVKEYWIVDPMNETIDVYVLEEGRFRHQGMYVRDDTIPVRLFPELAIELKNVFAEEE